MKSAKWEPRKRKPIREITVGRDYSGSRSPYWEFMEKFSENGKQEMAGFILEDPLANPDVYDESHSLYNRPLSETGASQLESIQDVVPKLPLREREAIELRGEGYTLDETAAKMGVAVRTVRTLIDRAKARIVRAYERSLLAD